MQWLTSEIENSKSSKIISGFHRALLQSITFINRINELDYKNLRS